DEDGNLKYKPVAPSFLDIKDDMERALAMKAYFNPFKNIIVFKKLIDFLGSLPVQLKNTDWGNKGYGTYKKVEGDETWHAKFEEVVAFENDFGRFRSTHRAVGKLRKKLENAENTQKPTGAADKGQPTSWAAQPHGWESDETPADRLEAMQGSNSNLLIANFEKRNKQGTIEYHLQQVKNANLKWRELPSVERHAYCERLSRLQGKGFGIPRVPSWTLLYDYNIKETLKDKMKYEYLHDDGDVFVDYSWERAFSIYGDVYLEWCLEFFSMMYFDKGVDRTRLMIEKCIWFRLCGVEKVLTLPEFTILLGLYEKDELNHGLFAIHFTKLEVNDKLFNHEEFWQKIGKPTSTNPRTSLIKESLMRIVHKLLVGSLVHRAGYLNKEEVAKCLEPIECETWTVKMLANELDEWTHTLMQTEQEAPRHGQTRRERQEPRGNNYILEHSAPILHHLADQSNFAYPAYEPPNVTPYPYPYVPYPLPYTHYPDTGSPYFGGDHYEAHGDGYHAGYIVPSLGYEIRGSLVGFHREDFDSTEDCVESDDDEMRD
ncbi:hypothetical protein Tco_1079658, partial [Tanacetum coccineum]